MKANTLTLTVNAVAKVLTRVNQDNFGSTYTLLSATDSWTLKFRNSTEVAKDKTLFGRHNVYVEYIVFATPTTVQKSYTISTTLRMSQSSDPAYLAYISSALSTLMTTEAPGLIGGES
ncbi:coat protein [ssRNA phage Gerhypos.2_11]|uniref:Coat protein n=2 Tax=Leviviricetes TaxID=2842243 RepID=A0A8S5KYJ9_9VIRU|nr:coat protein [ssRNA phage Gerhypos.2_11]QDH88938.1 MAG: hypothetical protein H2Bulk34354_000002 [Leviviridae sp.]DAD50252.1 TPA_asm: coat protein [ssRNA phage Gerhypos.2_11]